MLKQQTTEYWQVKSPSPLLYAPVSVLQLLTIHGKPDLSALELLQDQYPLYTPSIQDGNSFYRAAAFVYIISIDNWSFDTLFSAINEVNLTSVDIQTIPREFLNIYLNQQLKEAFREGWKTFVQDTSVGSTRSAEGLIQILNQRYLLDFLIILYFRSLNYLSVANKSRNYSVYSSTQSLEKSIKSYGTNSSTQQIKSLVKVLKSEIYIVTVDDRGNITTQIVSGTNSYYSVLKRLPLLRFRGSFNPLYNVKQAKTLRNVFKNQDIKQQEIQEDNFDSKIKINEKHPSFEQTEKTIIKNSQYNPAKKSKGIHIQFQDQQDEITPRASNSIFNTDAPLKTNPSRQYYDDHKYPYSNEENTWSFKRLARLLILILFFSSILLLFYRIKFSKTVVPENLKPAREVHFVKDTYGNYKIDY